MYLNLLQFILPFRLLIFHAAWPCMYFMDSKLVTGGLTGVNLPQSFPCSFAGISDVLYHISCAKLNF